MYFLFEYALWNGYIVSGAHEWYHFKHFIYQTILFIYTLCGALYLQDKNHYCALIIET